MTDVHTHARARARVRIHIYLNFFKEISYNICTDAFMSVLKGRVS